MGAVGGKDAFDRILCWGAGLVVLVVCSGAALEGQVLLAEQLAADARAIVAEDREVCLRLAAGPQTDQFSQCAIELSWVRSEERRRLAARTAIFP